MTRSSEEDARSVAVIGMAGRFPGASGPDQLWELLRDGVDATSRTPAERDPGRIGTTRAGHLDDVAGFDADFFGLSPTEAAELDPQQRLLMMSLWEGLEDAGLPPDSLAGSRTGVYVGNAQCDYPTLQNPGGPESITPAAINNYRALLAGRLSHVFDFRGPSVVVDSACSSSLVAVHQAVQSLRSGEVPLAVAAGTNLKLLPDESVLMSRAGTLASDGRSKFADASADGYGPSDGVAVVVLKPLAAALADGDRVRAVIRGSAVGNDGRRGDALLSPSVAGQVDVVRRAHQDAGVSPANVDFVEAHGAGIALDDSVELTALGDVLATGREPGQPCLVGTVKTNLGHSQAAAGITGLIKAVLCLEHGQVPASLHHRDPSPLVAWDHLPIEVPDTLRDLPDRGRPLVAGVNGQGLSTLNAHVVLCQGVAPPAHPSPTSGRETHALVLSARTRAALADLVRAHVDHLGPGGRGSASTLHDICFTASMRRQHHAHRLVVRGRTHEEMVTALLRPDGPEPGRVPEYDAGTVVSLPTYPWQTKRYWLDDIPVPAPNGDGTHDRPNDRPKDRADTILARHARTGYTDDSRLADIGIDSLALLRIVVQLGQDEDLWVDAADVAGLRTVGSFRQWLEGKQVQRA